MTGANGGDKLVSPAGLAFQSDKRRADYERLAAGAEHYGFGTVSVYGDLYFQPPVPALLAMARATSAIRLGPACLNPYMMHPVEIAGQIAALDMASGGRAFLGLARGSWLSELGVDQRDAPRAVMEAAAIVAALLKGDRAGVTGQHFVLPPGASLRQRPLRASIPLLIGTWGRRLGSMAAELADEVKIGGTANPEMVPLMQKWVSEGETAAGRSKNAVGIVAGAVTVVDEDGRLARAKARREVVMYLDVVGGFDPTFAFPPGLLEQNPAPTTHIGRRWGGKAGARRGARPVRVRRHAGRRRPARVGGPGRGGGPHRLWHPARDQRRPRPGTARGTGVTGYPGGEEPVTRAKP